MPAGFDHIARDYDSSFTSCETGKLQRKHVMAYLDRHILKADQIKILEINCGTGEDAIYFCKKGHEVCATDISPEMINVAKSKAEEYKLYDITFLPLSFQELPQDWMRGRFDLVFSNFGGLNCIDEVELAQLFKSVQEILKPNGRFVGVIMPGFCLWEMFYFSLKGKWKEVFRRNKKGPVTVNLKGVPVNTWYYSPGKIKKMSGDLQMVKIKPIGTAIPPSFMEGFFHNKKVLLTILERVEMLAAKIPLLAGFSDHFLFDMINVDDH